MVLAFRRLVRFTAIHGYPRPQALGDETVWVCRRIDIANHWLKHHPHPRVAHGPQASVRVAEPPPALAAAAAAVAAAAPAAGGDRLLVTGGAGFVLSNLVHHWYVDVGMFLDRCIQ